MSPKAAADSEMPALQAPPYPSDVRARGWRFELDLEQIHQSTTWKRCPPPMRAYLLRLYAESWTSVPAGSLEDDDELLAATLEIDLDTFRVNRQHLMRGWWRASDGRLYHRTITELVERMRDGRKADRERKRAKKQGAGTSADTGFRSESGRSGPLPTDSFAGTETGTGTGSGSGSGTGELATRAATQPRSDSPTRVPDFVSKHTGPAFAVNAKELPSATLRNLELRLPTLAQQQQMLLDVGVERQIAQDYLALRHAKRSPLTATALEAIRAESLKASMSVAEAIRIASQRGWIGFRATWLNERGDSNRAPPKSRAEALLAKNLAVAERLRRRLAEAGEFVNNQPESTHGET